MTSQLFILLGLGLVVLGLTAAVIHKSVLRQIIDINICGAGVFLIMVALAYRGPEQAPDPLLHALVLTGIVVAISATALALALKRKLEQEKEDVTGRADDSH